MAKLPMQGDDGSRPANAVLVSAKLVGDKVRIVIDRAKSVGENAWTADWPVTFKDFDREAFANVSNDDVQALGEIVFAELAARLDAKNRS